MQVKKILVGLLFVASSVQAGDATVSWTLPTTYEDGSALPTSEITTVTIYYGTTASGPYANSKIITSKPLPTSTVITGLGKGTWYFNGTITATNGLESAQSLEVNKQVWGSSKPRPPTLN